MPKVADAGYLLLDTETAGLDPECNPLLEIGARVLTPELEKDESVEPFLCFVKPILAGTSHEDQPVEEIDPMAIKINGHTWVYDKESPEYKRAHDPVEAWVLFSAWLRENYKLKNYKRIVMAGWNVNFDVKFLKRLFRGWYFNETGGNWSDDMSYIKLNDYEKRCRWPFHHHSLDLMAASRYLDIRAKIKRKGYRLEYLSKEMFGGAAELAMHTSLGDSDMSLRVVRSIEQEYLDVQRKAD